MTGTTSVTSESALQDLAEISLVGGAADHDPYPFFDRLLREAPVLWSNRHRAWLVSRHDLVSAALRDARVGSDRIGPFLEKRAGVDRDRFGRMFEILARWAVFCGPPDHTRLRGLVHKPFTPRRIAALQKRTLEISDQLAADAVVRLDRGEVVDLVEAFCVPLPGLVIAELFGVPPEDGARLRAWAEELGLFINGAIGTPERNERAVGAMADLVAYVEEVIAGYRIHPGDNILSGLVEVSDAGDALDEVELVATATMILDAGYKTVQNAMGNALLVLLERRELWQEAVNDERLASRVVEECLRFCAPGHVMVRTVLEEMTLADTVIPAGSRLFLLTGAANRDPAVFERPEDFDGHREDNRHLTFGQGIHFCLGASLARMEMSTGLRSLGRVIGDVELAVESSELDWHNELILHGITGLPVRRPEAAT